MEIELPSGQVLEIPDGADPKVFVDEFRRQRREAFRQKYEAEDKAKNNPTAGMSGMEKFRAGIGSGMAQVARGATNFLLPDSLTPEFASDENIAEAKRLDTPLGQTGAGMAGQFVGNVAATAPVGMGLNALRGVQGLGRAGQVLRATLSNPAGFAAVEGAATGALTADPGDRLQGAAMGGVLGGAMSKLAQGGGRLVRGLVKKSKEAEDLAQLAAQHGEDIFVPLSQAASEEDIISRLAKTGYREALPNIPGIKGRLTRQADEAAEAFRKIAVDEALPPGMARPTGQGLEQTVKSLKAGFDKAYDDTIKSYSFNVPSDFKNDLVTRMSATAGPNSKINKVTLGEVSDKVDDLMQKFSDGGATIDGTNLINVKRGISDLIGTAKNHEKPLLVAADKMLDDLVETELKMGNKAANLADLKKYQDITPAYRAFTPLAGAVKSAAGKQGNFSFSSLARKAKNSPEQKALGELGAQVLDKSPANASFTGRILGGAAIGGMGAYMSPAAALGALGTGYGLTTKTAQKLLMGDTGMQKRLAEALRKNQKLIRELGSATRRGIVTEAVDNDG